ncbi:MAG: hypothetical protein CMB99_00995 [Flavobacteriaceae bacterium]|nr:hypothetical protein [Flavobacteriaceae bacterium]
MVRRQPQAPHLRRAGQHVAAVHARAVRYEHEPGRAPLAADLAPDDAGGLGVQPVLSDQRQLAGHLGPLGLVERSLLAGAVRVDGLDPRRVVAHRARAGDALSPAQLDDSIVQRPIAHARDVLCGGIGRGGQGLHGGLQVAGGPSPRTIS